MNDVVIANVQCSICQTKKLKREEKKWGITIFLRSLQPRSIAWSSVALRRSHP